MNIKIFLILTFLFLNSVVFGAELPKDSTSRGKTETEETIKGRSPRDRTHNSFDSDESSCLSSCCSFGLPTLIDILINSGDNPENDENKRRGDTSVIRLNPYRFLIGLGGGISALNTNAKEYEEAGILIDGSITAFINDFFVTTSFAYSYNNAKPYNDFITKVKLSDGTVKEYEDILDKSHVATFILGVGLGYQINLIKNFEGSRLDLGIFGKANYISLKETSSLKRYTYINNVLTNSSDISQELKTHKFAPSFGLNFIFIPDFNPRLSLEGGFEALIYNREPEYTVSVPLDWEKFSGFVFLTFGVKYEL